MSKDWKDKLEEAKFKRQEILKIIPDLEDSVSKVKKDWWWEGWIDFDVGDQLNPINMYSIKVAGDQRDIAKVVEYANKQLVASQLSRNAVNIIKRMFKKKDVDILAEQMNRPTSSEQGTV